MGSRRIEENANQNVDGDEEASSAKKCLQEAHFRSHPLVDACDAGRPRVQPSGRSAELVPSRHTPPADLVAPPLGTQTCHDACHHKSCVAIRRVDTPYCHRLSRHASRLAAPSRRRPSWHGSCARHRNGTCPAAPDRPPRKAASSGSGRDRSPKDPAAPYLAI